MAGEALFPGAEVGAALGFGDEELGVGRGRGDGAAHEVGGVAQGAEVGGAVGGGGVEVGADPVEAGGLGPVVLADDR